MTARELLTGLRDLGVHLTLLPDGEDLQVDAPVGVLTDALRQALGQNKEPLITMIEWFEERAGILEFEAGMTRAAAESEAWKQLEERWQ